MQKILELPLGWRHIRLFTAKPNSVTKYYYLGADRVAMRNGDGVFYLHGDHLGSTSLITNENGEVASENRYYPFGEERFADESKQTDFLFTGQRSEAGFGLMDYLARFYSPRLGKFISPDIIIPDLTNSQDWNRYSYVRNSPLVYSDPTGNCPAPDSGDNVICIDLFIASWRIALGFGEGDDRSFDSDSEPEQSRAYLYINLDEDGNLLDSVVHINHSCTIVGCAGPYEDHNTFIATQNAETGNIHVEWNLLNGATSMLHEVSEDLENISELNGHAPGRLLGPVIRAVASVALPAIDGKLTLEHSDEGNYELSSFDRDPYPSLEIYQYRSGQPPRTIGTFDQIRYLTPSIPLNPAFPNAVY